PAAVGALAALAEQFALPVVQAEARDMNLPTDHPMHLGHDAGAFLPKADVVIVIDSVVPWMPRNHQPRKDAKVTPFPPPRSRPAIRSARSKRTSWSRALRSRPWSCCAKPSPRR